MQKTGAVQPWTALPETGKQPARARIFICWKHRTDGTGNWTGLRKSGEGATTGRHLPAASRFEQRKNPAKPGRQGFSQLQKGFAAQKLSAAGLAISGQPGKAPAGAGYIQLDAVVHLKLNRMCG